MSLSRGIKDVDTTRKAVRANEVLLRELVKRLEDNEVQLDATTAASGVIDVTAGSSMVTVSPTSGHVVVNVVPANFSGIPESGVVNLVSDLASKVPGTRLINTTLPLTGGGALTSDLTLAVNTFTSGASGVVPASGGGTVNFLRADGTWNHPMVIGSPVDSGTSGSVLYVGTGPVLAQDNASLFWDATNKVLGIGSNTPGTGIAVLSDMHVILDGSALGSGHAFIGVTTTATNADAGYYMFTKTNGVDAAMFLDEADSQKLKFSTGSWADHAAMKAATKMTIQQNGNVGIGTTSPAQPLHVVGTPRFSSFTQGSVPFFRANGDVSQDNTGLFFDATNRRLGIGTTSPVYTLHVKNISGVSGQTCGRLENTSTGGYAALELIDATGTFKAGLGWANSAATVSYLQNSAYLYSAAGQNWVVADGTGVALTFYPVSGSVGLGLANGSSLGVSSANQGRLRYNTTGQKFQASANAGSYQDMVLASATGTANTTAKFTAANTIANGWALDDGTTWGVSGKFAITEATGATLISGPAQVNNTFVVSLPSAQTANIGVNISEPGTGQTADLAAALYVHSNGSFDGTAAVRNNTTAVFEANASRSAGANNVNNVAATFSSAGAQTNYALKTLNGDVQIIAGVGNLGFNGSTPIAKPTVTGSRGGNAALASLLTALANYGLITDSSSA